MSNAQKDIISTFFYCLQNITLVAQIIGQPWTTVKSFLVWTYECQSLENLLRPSHTPILSHPQCHIIIRAANSNQKMTRSDFRINMHLLALFHFLLVTLCTILSDMT
ncbi:hypothetical protein L873DRAFT_1861655 [Choiromyces venosus 120613-1]|uniref:Uncharacterized protein n=1 Tax=Choiromyces venosus 120613-1 TaxID=1336337 RepID=A0A3N4JF74_9PEZI|nr:hypothetical protein L873DRAFT_1861655 [Choiromyces venosus 120613-1]